ncbi:hypothetical protein [Pseudoduganella sp. RAF53_2]|uniref:hypothetical protein n=1 Tax=unclassified Pseudoduganella TaxID=2637179 RepID=UPI003F9940DA
MLQSLARDEVFIEQQDQSRIGPFRASVSPTQATLFEEHIDVQEGQILIRVLPQREERYLITTAYFSQGLSAIPPNWQLKLSKTTAIRDQPLTKNTTVNIHQSNGIQVGDNNTQSIEIAIENLLQRIENAKASTEQKAEAKGLLAKFLAHPLVTAVVGAGVTSLIG